VRDVSIIALGQTKVDEHWQKSIRHLAADAILAALEESNPGRIDAIYVGNMISGEAAGQEHLGALIADFVGLRGVEAIKVEAACGSGAASVRMGYIAVASGLADFVIAAGVEKMTDAPGEVISAALALAADGDYETNQGLTFVSINALLMRRYMHEFRVRHEDFAGFTVNAHRNAEGNPNAMFRYPVTADQFAHARMIADPINLLDSSPIGDGAAAVVLCPSEIAHRFSSKPVRILASTVATDSVALHDRRDPLSLNAAFLASQKAYSQAGIKPQDVDLFEAHDAFTIMAALELEACGFAERGCGVRLAQEGEVALNGRIPISTMGGLKGRGHPVGATGVFQIIETAQQLRGEAGPNQISDCRIGMAQNIGGSGATVVTHILERQG